MVTLKGVGTLEGKLLLRFGAGTLKTASFDLRHVELQSVSKSRSRPSEVVGFLNLKEHQNRNPYFSFILLSLWAIAANTDGFMRAQQAPAAHFKPHMKAGIKSLHSLWKSSNLNGKVFCLCVLL